MRTLMLLVVLVALGIMSVSGMDSTMVAEMPMNSSAPSVSTAKWNPTLQKLLQTPTDYEESQEPYKSMVAMVLNGTEYCGPIDEDQAQELWAAAGQNGTAPSGFADILSSAINVTVWAYPLMSTVSTVPSISAQAALQSDVEASNVVAGQPPLAVNTVMKFDLANHTTDAIVAPNSDTMYTSGFLDLTGGPLVFNIPDSQGRFYVMQMLDAYTNIPFTVGALNSPMGRDLRYVLVPPDYQGPPIPDGYDYQAYFTTPLVWILGRIFSAHNETDQAAAKAFQNSISITPLFADNYTLPTALSDLAYAAVQAAVVPSLVKEGNLSSWWPLLGKAVQLNPPWTADGVAELDEYEPTLGLSSAGFSMTDLTPERSLGLNLGLAAGLQCVEVLSFLPLPETSTRWSAPANNIKLDTSAGFVEDASLVGGFFDDDALRTVIARLGLGANPPKTAVYFVNTGAVADPTTPALEQEKLPLDGSLYNYTMTLPSYPNVTGFWSITVYKDGDRFFFGDVPYNAETGEYRYNVNEGTPGVNFNDGQNFTIYMSATPPPVGSEVHKNWIPIGKVPDSKFAVYMRMYGPPAEAVDGRYTPPPVIAHKGTWGEPTPSAAAAA